MNDIFVMILLLVDIIIDQLLEKNMLFELDNKKAKKLFFAFFAL
jgi:hypothetical protein